MPTKQKAPNYTEKQVADMTSMYQAAKDNYPTKATDTEKFALRNKAMDDIAAFIGKTVPSIRSKLGIIGIYEGKPEGAKTSSGKRITKRDLVNVIADLGKQKNDKFFDSIEGANKTVLEFVIATQKQLVEAQDTLSMSVVVEALHSLDVSEIEMDENVEDAENEDASDELENDSETS
jgi:hypothetical protein